MAIIFIFNEATPHAQQVLAQVRLQCVQKKNANHSALTVAWQAASLCMARVKPIKNENV